MPPFGKTLSQDKVLSPEEIKRLGNLILGSGENDGINFFDRSIPVMIRVVKSAIRNQILKHGEGIHNLDSALLEYIKTELKNDEETRENMKALYEAEQKGKDDQELRDFVSDPNWESKFDPDDDAETIQEIKRWIQENSV